MKHKRHLALAMALFLMSAITLFGEEKFGIKVYDGAKYDEATSKAVSESMSVEAYCYRTSDSVGKVAEFYKKQPGLELVGESEEGAMFKKGEVNVTIQSPWMDMQTGQMIQDTLITIAKDKDE